jgi:hypothetical protein
VRCFSPIFPKIDEKHLTDSAAAEWCDLANFHPCCMERAIFPGKGREGAATEWCDM